VHQQKGMLDKQANEIKELNVLNDLWHLCYKLWTFVVQIQIS
jgi:hypothetical protein